MKGGYNLNDESIQEAYKLLKNLKVDDDTLIDEINIKEEPFRGILRAGVVLGATDKPKEEFDLIRMLTKEDIFKGKTVGDLRDMKLEKSDIKLYQLLENTFFLEPEALDIFLTFGIVTLTTLQSKIPEEKLNK